MVTLVALDAEIGKSKDLSAEAPLKLVSSGGFVAVEVLGNREETTEIDYMLNPDSLNLERLSKELYKAIGHVARKQNISPDWMKGKMENFVEGNHNDKHRFVRGSVSQDLVLWRGANLIIYAAEWHWALAQKLKMMENGREVDTCDAVAILNEMFVSYEGPIPRHIIQSWNNLTRSPIKDSAIDRLAASFLKRYGEAGIDESWEKY
ncbi:hypothetical protein ACHAPT_001035 [Fusarium lateritium]